MISGPFRHPRRAGVDLPARAPARPAAPPAHRPPRHKATEMAQRPAEPYARAHRRVTVSSDRRPASPPYGSWPPQRHALAVVRRFRRSSGQSASSRQSSPPCIRVGQPAHPRRFVAVQHVNTPAQRPSQPASRPAANWPTGRSRTASTKQLPQASATGIIHSGTMAGKLNGVMPATTPAAGGWRSCQCQATSSV